MSKENIKSKDANVKELYRDRLEPITKARYMEKIKQINGKDPYEMSKDEWKLDFQDWPDVTYPDIVNYLVYQQSAYTLAELKAFKSLESYNYFTSGWVLEMGHSKINDRSVFLGRVKHSQRMNDVSLRPWVIVERDGSINSGHCTCMAGIGEVCSHVGALLWAVDTTCKIRNSKTPTEEKAYWMLPFAVNKVQYKTVSDINFTSAKTKKKKLDQAIIDGSPAPEPKQRKLPTVGPPTKNDLDGLYLNLSRIRSKPAVLSIVPQYAKMYRPKVLDKKYPQILSELYSEEKAALQKPQLIAVCEDVFETIKVTSEEAENCERITKDQANSKLWFSFRIGRITASRAKRVCRTTVDNPSKSLVKDICYPISRAFTSKQTKWGCDHEKDAKVHYIQHMLKNHINFKWHECGLMISPDYPFLGATPDGKATCDCCDPVLVEIKCPYCQRDENISSAVDCLKEKDGQISLDEDHAYYYQVQCQLLVSNVKSCDFVVWTSKDFFSQRIVVDPPFCLELTQLCRNFFKKCILPELVGKIFSKPFQPQPSSSTIVNQPEQLVICTCRAIYNEETDDVIGCDNGNCPYVWFHFKCARIKRIPDGQWFCKHCKVNMLNNNKNNVNVCK